MLWSILHFNQWWWSCSHRGQYKLPMFWWVRSRLGNMSVLPEKSEFFSGYNLHAHHPSSWHTDHHTTPHRQAASRPRPGRCRGSPRLRPAGRAPSGGPSSVGGSPAQRRAQATRSQHILSPWSKCALLDLDISSMSRCGRRRFRWDLRDPSVRPSGADTAGVGSTPVVGSVRGACCVSMSAILQPTLGPYPASSATRRSVVWHQRRAGQPSVSSALFLASPLRCSMAVPAPKVSTVPQQHLSALQMDEVLPVRLFLHDDSVPVPPVVPGVSYSHLGATWEPAGECLCWQTLMAMLEHGAQTATPVA